MQQVRARPDDDRALDSKLGQPRGRDLKRSEEHTPELPSQSNLVCRLLLEKKKRKRAAESKLTPAGSPEVNRELPSDPGTPAIVPASWRAERDHPVTSRHSRAGCGQPISSS